MKAVIRTIALLFLLTAAGKTCQAMPPSQDITVAEELSKLTGLLENHFRTTDLKHLEQEKISRDKEYDLKLKQYNDRMREHRTKLDQEAIIAADNRKARMTMLKYTLASTPAFISFFFGAYYLFKLVSSKIGMPTIIDETNHGMLGTKDQKHLDRSDEFVAPQKLKDRLQVVTEQLNDALASGSEVFNLLFFGPPGTGKTMYAKSLARKLGMTYFITSGARFASLAERKDGSALRELDRLYDIAKKVADKGSKVMVFLDEAETMLRKRRSEKTTKEMEDFVTGFLSKVEAPSHPNIMFVVATNIPAELDPAVQSRFSKSHWIYFPQPDQASRQEMLKTYLAKLSQGRSEPITIQQGLPLDHYAAKTEGRTGRDLEEIAKNMIRKAALSQNKVVSQEIADHVIQELDTASQDISEFEQSKLW
jgi:ATPase family AAA domain-containing protein 3A/B